MFPWVAACALTAAVHPHMYLSREASIHYIVRWKPQIVAGNIVSVSGLNAYTRTRLCLEDETCLGALVRPGYDEAQPALFVLKNIQLRTCVIHTLWSTSSDHVPLFRDLREWYRHWLGDDLRSRLDGDDALSWESSSFPP